MHTVSVIPSRNTDIFIFFFAKLVQMHSNTDFKTLLCSKKLLMHILKEKGMIMLLTIDTISAEELDFYMGRQDAVIIDLRDTEEYKRSHLKTAVNIPYEEIQKCRRFPKEKLLVLYCSRGSSSLFAARELMKMGYKVKSVVGGIRCYKGSNLYFSNSHSKIKK